MDAVAPRVRRLMARMGYKEHSSGRLFDTCFQRGMGTRPLIVGYENQLGRFVLAQPAVWQAARSSGPAPVVLYAQPTIMADRQVASLAEPGDRSVEAVTDPELVGIAWRDHRFRGALGSLPPDTDELPGVPATTTRVATMPEIANMAALLGELSEV